ncbi:MAG: hypothetical protein JNK82_30225 [Myxococcaceae bacterium]|nr:hypothetical protein [Myxococcaceae bacterium]
MPCCPTPRTRRRCTFKTLLQDLRGHPRNPRAEALFEAIVGLIALSGGLTLAFSPDGSAAKLPLSLLAGTGFSSYLVPGLLLAFAVGGLNLFAATQTLRRRPSSSLVSLAAGGSSAVFVLVELLLTHAFHPLQPVMFGLGLVIMRLSLPSPR